MATETTKLTFVEGAAASTPAASRAVIYAKADGLMYSKDDAGVETLMSSGAAGGGVATDPIWDAAGDLAVGSGANTAARLAIGAAGGALSRVNGAVAWNSGTSNPGAAAAGDRYWRTDLGLEIYYDGTRWLTVTKYPHYFSMLDAAVNTGITATQNAARGEVPFKGIRGIWVEEFQAATFVSTTNNGTNFWTVALVRQDLDAASNTVTSFSTGTAPDTASKHVAHVTSSVGAVLDTSAVVLNVTVTKTLSPGLILVSGAIMWYRGIVT